MKSLVKFMWKVEESILWLMLLLFTLLGFVFIGATEDERHFIPYITDIVLSVFFVIVLAITLGEIIARRIQRFKQKI